MIRITVCRRTLSSVLRVPVSLSIMMVRLMAMFNIRIIIIIGSRIGNAIACVALIIGITSARVARVGYHCISLCITVDITSHITNNTSAACRYIGLN